MATVQNFELISVKFNEGFAESVLKYTRKQNKLIVIKLKDV
jgi:hypothetical protein